MSTLQPHIPFDPGETLLSYASRLAAIHTGKAMSHLLMDLGVSVDRFCMGQLDAIKDFSDATGNDLSKMTHSAMTAMKEQVAFRGERMSKSFLIRQADKYCPDCLAEDGDRVAWRQQLIWCVAPVHRCLNHGTWLQRIEGPGFDLRSGLDRPAPALKIPDGLEVPAYLLWLEARFQGTSTDNEWLTTQSIQQVLEASKMLGATLEHGHKVRPKTLSVEDQETAIDIGFCIYREGPDAVTEAFDAIRSTSSARAVQAGPLAMYGTLFDWLARRCNFQDPGPIRDILRDHIVKTDAVANGETVLGVAIDQRRFHSIQSLSEETGINRKRLSRLLQKLGKVPTGATDAESGRLRFDADQITGLIREFNTAIEMKDVPDYIGTTLSQMRALYAAGILTPVVPRDAPGAVRRVVFSRKHLDEFQARIADLPVANARAAEGLKTIAFTCQRGAGTTAELVGRILDGKIRAWRRDGPLGLRQVLVSPAEAIAIRTK